MKLNLGCGNNKRAGFVNVDLFEECAPDQLWDLDVTPWPWPTGSAEEVVFNHSLEHIGADHQVFLRIMQELYRVCAHGAVVNIAVPHPRHDNFINDPGHVRIITPELLGLFSLRNNRLWQQQGAANSPYAQYLGVDFETVHVSVVLDPRYESQFQTGQLSKKQIADMARRENNVVAEYHIKLVAVKDG